MKPSQPTAINSNAVATTSGEQVGEMMRVITEVFSIESEQLVLGGATNNLTPAIVKDAITAYREWLGMHEGENRIALLGKPIQAQTHT